MDNNDILRKLRFTYDYSDNAMIDIFALAGMKVTRAEVSDWLKKEEDPAFQKMVDVQLAAFLNGMIYMNRGKQEGKELPPEERLNNNIILRKLKIALNLKDEDIINILRLVDFELGKPELTSFFRATSQPQYRPLKDQIMRKFLHGLQLSVGRQE
jgi:uncharacterized protein YehS (DUF1456 family)